MTSTQPNLVNVSEIDRFVNAVFARVGVQEADAKPLRTLAMRSLSVRKARLARVVRARPDDPTWVSLRLTEGVTLHRFHSARADKWGRWIERRAKRVADLRKLADQQNSEAAERARRFLKSLERRDLEALLDQSRPIVRADNTTRIKERFEQRLYDEAPIELSERKRWVRLTSLAEIDALGREAGNCLERGGQGWRDRMLRVLSKHEEVWVLRSRGAIRAIASVDRRTRTIPELEGPDSEDVETTYRDDVLALVRTCSIRLAGGPGSLALGILPVMAQRDLPPSAVGKVGRTRYRVWRRRGGMLIELGAAKPVYAYYRVRTNRSLEDQGLACLADAECAEAVDPDDGRPARVILDVVRRTHRRTTTLAALAALAAEEVA